MEWRIGAERSGAERANYCVYSLISLEGVSMLTENKRFPCTAMEKGKLAVVFIGGEYRLRPCISILFAVLM